MADTVQQSIFRNGSRTYFHSSLFFPGPVKRDVSTLYAFVRTADDLVDSIPQKKEDFFDFCARWRESTSGVLTGDHVIDSFTELSVRKGFSDDWTAAFLSSMEADLTKHRYETIAELDCYLYGSAEVIGLFMARILDLPEHAFPQARMLGRAMQFVNFIRDIAEDLMLGRVYFPQEDLTRFSLASLDYATASLHPEAFRSLVRFEIARYTGWQTAGEQGYAVIPYRYLVPIKTASDMYRWTARVIADDPFVVFHRKVKPAVPRILAVLAANAVRIPAGRPFRSPKYPAYGI